MNVVSKKLPGVLVYYRRSRGAKTRDHFYDGMVPVVPQETSSERES